MPDNISQPFTLSSALNVYQELRKPCGRGRALGDAFGRLEGGDIPALAIPQGLSQMI